MKSVHCMLKFSNGISKVVKPIICLQYIKEKDRLFVCSTSRRKTDYWSTVYIKEKDKCVSIEWQKRNYFWQLCKAIVNEIHVSGQRITLQLVRAGGIHYYVTSCL